MTSYHCVYIMANTMSMTSFPLYMMSHTLCVRKHKLYIWLETHSICHHIYCICHDTHSFEPITPTMQDITGGICMPSYALSMTSYPHFMSTILSIYDITCTVFMTSHALYMTCHLLCVISHSLYVWLLTMTVSMTKHTLHLWHISFIWHHTQRYDNPNIVCFTTTMSDITPTVSVSSHPMYQLYQTQCSMTSQLLYVQHLMHHLWHHIHSLWHHTTLFMSSSLVHLT